MTPVRRCNEKESMHRWTEADDLAALYVFRVGTTGVPYSLDTIAQRRGIEPNSFKMRVGNFKALAGQGGLANYSRQSVQVFERHNRRTMEELRALAFPELT
jgi:hypothetical protein